MSEADRYRHLAAMARRLARAETRSESIRRLEARAIIYDARAVMAESDEAGNKQQPRHPEG